MRFMIYQVSGAEDEIRKLSKIDKKYIPYKSGEVGYYQYYVDIESLSELLNIIQKTGCNILISRDGKNSFNKSDSFYEICIADDWLG